MATITTDDPSNDTAGESPDEQEVAHAAVAARKKKIKAAILVVGLTAVMMGIGYLFIMPDSSAENLADGEESAIAAEELDDDTAEIEIGQFNCTNSRAGIDVSVHVNFTLVAEVQKSNEQAFRDAMEAYDARIRDIVNSLARSASRDDLNDPRLDTIKREFREGVNQVIRKHYIVRVHIPDWQTMER